MGRGDDRRAEGVRAKAQALRAKGLPDRLADAVAQGRLSEAEALERAAVRSEADFLMRKHGLDRALATQIAHGHADLDKTLAKRRFEAHRAEHRGRSVLEEARQDGLRRFVLRSDGEEQTVTVQAVSPYAVEVARDGTSMSWHKLDVALVAPAAAARKVQRALKSRPDVEPTGPAARPQERYRLGDQRLFRYLDEEREIEVSLVSGHRIRGHVVWLSRYEFGLRIKGDVEVGVLRHALARVRAVDGAAR